MNDCVISNVSNVTFVAVLRPFRLTSLLSKSVSLRTAPSLIPKSAQLVPTTVLKITVVVLSAAIVSMFEVTSL